MANQLLIKNTMADMRALSAAEITALTNGTYSGVQLLGYYQAGDTPGPIDYYISFTTDPDDGGSVIELSTIKLQHDFVGEVNVQYFGTRGNFILDDTQAIQKTLTYANKAHVSSVYFPTGHYLITDTLIPPTACLIYGDGNGSHLEFKHERFSISKTVKWMFKLSDHKNISFHNLQLDGGATTNRFPILPENPIGEWDVDGAEFLIYFKPIYDGAVDNINITNCCIKRSWSSGIQSYGRAAEPYPHPLTTNVRITDCYFTETGNHGVGFNEVANATVSNNNFVNVGRVIPEPTNQYGSGLAVDCSGGCIDIVVSNNTVDGAGGGFKCESHVVPVSPTFPDGINYSRRIIFSNNTIKNLYLDTAMNTTNFFIIFYGIRLAGDNCIASDNIIVKPQGHGILISSNGSNCTVSNNKIIEPQRTGIEVGSNLGFNTILDNRIIKSVLQGITVNGSNTLVKNNMINNAGNTGIRLLNGNNCQFIGNTIVDSVGDGISVIPTGTFTSDNIDVVDNICYDSRIGGDRTQTNGIIANAPSVTNVKSMNNRCFNNINTQISVANSARRNQEIGSNAWQTQTINGLATVSGTWQVGDVLKNVNAVVQHSDPQLKYTYGWYNNAPDGRNFIPFGFLGEYAGVGSPEGVVVARQGSRYNEINEAGVSSIWIKRTGGGNTGWISIFQNATTAAKGLVSQSTSVTNSLLPNATDLNSVIALTNDLKTILNAKLQADRNSGQQAI
ncbi:right-handed parallel beta-helix repeat-containing protein [Sphingobacterium multivorum]|uniref:right-handed parallel beta-helix repeat-containing protein n=1 Tax=Sphingobacterium multivorum TaxID=28454 RepID=UPI0031BA730C